MAANDSKMATKDSKMAAIIEGKITSRLEDYFMTGFRLEEKFFCKIKVTIQFDTIFVEGKIEKENWSKIKIEIKIKINKVQA